MFDHLTKAQRDALWRMIADWISEGFTTPPYEDAQYDIFEALGLDEDDPAFYNTKRPETRHRRDAR